MAYIEKPRRPMRFVTRLPQTLIIYIIQPMTVRTLYPSAYAPAEQITILTGHIPGGTSMEKTLFAGVLRSLYSGIYAYVQRKNVLALRQILIT